MSNDHFLAVMAPPENTDFGPVPRGHTRGTCQLATDEGTIVIIEPDADYAGDIGRRLGRRCRLEVAGTLEEGRELLGRVGPVTAVVSELVLPDGSGLDVLERAAVVHPGAMLIVCTRHLLRESLARANAIGAVYLLKEGGPAMLVERLKARSIGVGDALGRALELASVQHALTPRERDILSLAAADVPRGKIAERLQISDNTLKVHVKSLLHKTRALSLDELARRVRAPVWQPA
jgi:DNA-binding NarL/FixJ family response regulator